MPLHCNGSGGVMLRISWRAGGNGSGSKCNTMPPKPLKGDFLFAPLFVGLPTLQGDAFCGAMFLFEQTKGEPPTPWASAIAMPGALSGAIPSLQAQHKEQHPLFFVKLLSLPQCWHCHEAARAEANLWCSRHSPPNTCSLTNSVTPLGGALRCPWRKIWEERTVPVPIRRAYMCSLSPDQNSTPYIKRWQNQREAQLSVVIPPQHFHMRENIAC